MNILALFPTITLTKSPCAVIINAKLRQARRALYYAGRGNEGEA